MELPFELPKHHKCSTLYTWKKRGLITTDDEIQSIYYMYIYTTHCELCNKEFEKRNDRQMEHNHETGEFRNIVCKSCNLKKTDKKIYNHNTSGYTGICKHIYKRCKQGFYWRFRVTIDNKLKTIKSSVDFDKLVEFADKWKIENNYNT